MQNMKLFYLVGKNKKNSFSPLLHNKLFQVKGKQNCRYGIYQDGILPSLDQFKNKKQLYGISISIPFKKSYSENAQYLNKSELVYEGQFARKTKIINTLIKIWSNQNYIFKAYNTDIFGIQKVFQPMKMNKNALLLGAGATAQTFCYYLQKLSNCQNIYIYNRTQSKIDQLKKIYDKVKNIKQWTQKSQFDLIINSLPSEVIKQDLSNYQKLINHLKFGMNINFMDVNYRGKQMEIKKMIKNQNIRITQFSGLDMLIWQAIQQNRHFCSDSTQNQEKQNSYFKILKEVTSK